LYWTGTNFRTKTWWGKIVKFLSNQCCGSRSGTGKIRKFWPDPDPIQNRNKRFGSGLCLK
jgi:hypothetical protein